ncbi:MAG: hypothetical protein KAY37_04685 [Phycisphaerae bacterium]|nr:hypothetical protein [Phycisphaerae bacterium]
MVEEIADHPRLKRMDELPDAVWMRIENDPVFAPELLDQERVFTVVLTAGFRLWATGFRVVRHDVVARIGSEH